MTSGLEKVQELKHTIHKVFIWHWFSYQKDTEASLQELPLAKGRTIWVSK